LVGNCCQAELKVGQKSLDWLALIDLPRLGKKTIFRGGKTGHQQVPPFPRGFRFSDRFWWSFWSSKKSAKEMETGNQNENENGKVSFSLSLHYENNFQA